MTCDNYLLQPFSVILPDDIMVVDNGNVDGFIIVLLLQLPSVANIGATFGGTNLQDPKAPD